MSYIVFLNFHEVQKTEGRTIQNKPRTKLEHTENKPRLNHEQTQEKSRTNLEQVQSKPKTTWNNAKIFKRRGKRILQRRLKKQIAIETMVDAIIIFSCNLLFVIYGSTGRYFIYQRKKMPVFVIFLFKTNTLELILCQQRLTK